jgi:hypothetical protein
MTIEIFFLHEFFSSEKKALKGFLLFFERNNLNKSAKKSTTKPFLATSSNVVKNKESVIVDDVDDFYRLTMWRL